MDQAGPMRVQLCGRFSVEPDGRRLPDLPGRQSRLLFAYLVLNRTRPRHRDELMDAIWGDDLPPAADSALSALVSKLRNALGAGILAGRGDPQLRLPAAGSFVDVEAAFDRLHTAQSALHTEEPVVAYTSAITARYISGRAFLPGFERPWVEAFRRELAEVHVHALECFARACLTVGGTELAAAERAVRELVGLTPYRESAHALQMETLIATGNVAEALLAYDRLRRRLRDDLGVNPGPGVQAVYQRLLALSGGA
jgi:SARP family transcriptional regulator, regulator of embCAB operon